MLSNDAKAVIVLTTRLGNRQRPSLTAQGWHDLSASMQEAGLALADVFDPSVDLRQVAGIDEETGARLEQLLADGAAATLEADDLSRKGIWSITIVDDDYPSLLRDRLGRNAPPALFGVGDRDLLLTSGVGVVGSREIDEKGAEVAQALAREAVGLGRAVVSGGARGVDQLAMNAAFMAGGKVVGVLADALLSRIRKPDVLGALDEGTTCLVTQQTPSSGFTPAAAMNRNKLIYALSEVTVVVASEQGSGGTWAGATEAIRAKNGLVGVWRGEGEGPGNAELERLGAVQLKATEDLATLLDRPPDQEPEQLSLIDRR